MWESLAWRGGHDDNLPAAGLHRQPVDDELRLAALDDENLGIGVKVRGGPAAGGV